MVTNPVRQHKQWEGKNIDLKASRAANLRICSMIIGRTKRGVNKGAGELGWTKFSEANTAVNGRKKGTCSILASSQLDEPLIRSIYNLIKGLPTEMNAAVSQSHLVPERSGPFHQVVRSQANRNVWRSYCSSIGMWLRGSGRLGPCMRSFWEPTVSSNRTWAPMKYGR